MEETARVFSFWRNVRQRRNKGQGQERELASFKEGLVQTRADLTQAYANFNHTTDPDLIECFVYEINSLQAKYAYQLRRVKELEKREGRGSA